MVASFCALLTNYEIFFKDRGIGVQMNMHQLFGIVLAAPK